ncbi:MAG: rhodanese-like domain-containing protein [Alphaproteobacteria bacterium]
MIHLLDPREANRLVLGEGEIAFLDLREAGPFSEGHPLFAVPAPYSTLEARVGQLVPRVDVPVVLVDGGDGIAEAGAEALAAMGYSDVAIVEGGAPGWEAADLTLFKGVNVPSKALGELAEALWHPKTIDARTLSAWQRDGRSFSLFDCRPPGEFEKMTVPGAACLPNGEIAHRLPALDAEKPIVVTCAGRTRGIIGSLGLARVIPAREIYALENGTQGWALAGFELSRGNEPGALPDLTPEQAAETRARADAFLAAENIPLITSSDVAAFLDNKTRTTFVFDVRSADEAKADPLPAFTHAWSGQIVQATDRWVGVRRARLVLADDLGLRAGLAAFWLRALGFDVHVVRIDDVLRAMPAPKHSEAPAIDIPEITAEEALADVRKNRAGLLDLRPSGRYAAGHVEDSTWSIRPHLREVAGKGRWLLIGDDGPEVRLGARELLCLGHTDLALIQGGIDAMRRAGAGFRQVRPLPPAAAADITSFAHGRHDGDLAASREYLAWEQGLVATLSADERAAFRL